MCNAIIITADGNISRAEVNGLVDLQKFVGGRIEGIRLGDTNQFAYLNEDGIALGLPYNKAATDLCYKHNVGLIQGDFIKGTMIIVGPADEDGNDMDVSDALAKELGV